MREPFLADADCTLYHGDVLATLRELPDESVDCAATSPPFYGLRDYGVEGQIGLEETPELWRDRLVEVFREVRRVLVPTGTLWVECGDSYGSGTDARRNPTSTASHGNWENAEISVRTSGGVKPKDLIGAPFLLAFGLRADGWYWRGCNIWAKPNCMPESAKDRCTTAHSYVLHFSKSSRYYFDGDAVSEPAAWERWGDQTVPKHEGTETAAGWIGPKTKHELVALGNRSTNGRKERTDERRGFDNRLERADGMKHPRSVWTIPTSGYPGAHFATWPPKLAERIILAGCPKDGTVLDPFAGSGTTLVVARRLGRRAVGIELNESYCELARARIANWWRDPPQPRQPDEAQASLFATEGAA